MIQLKNLIKDFGTKNILNNISKTIYDGEKIGIIGANGQGKSTLLDIITKQIPPDSGEVVFLGNFAMLRQSSDFDTTELEKFIQDTGFANEFFKWLKRFGFKAEFNIDDFDKLSCGEKTKLALSIAFAQNPDWLVLDEPTNHLDFEAKQLLIQSINKFAGTILIVSHDKNFLNNTVHKIWELKNGALEEFYGNYDDYLEQKRKKDLEIARNYEKHKKEMADIERQIDIYQRALEISDKKTRNGAKRTCSTTTQSERATSLSRFASNRVSKLRQKLNEDVEKPDKEIKIKYSLTKENLKSKYAIIAENLGKRFGDRVLFENANFMIESGDKVALIGNNGYGKTTLINMILGKEDFEGNLRITPSLKIAVMSQDVYDLNENTTINEMSALVDKAYRTAFITNLCNMNIDKSRFNTKVKYLSSGEKMRLKLCELILSDANMIILDEPTNHLDILNKDYLELVLRDFVGTLLIVSHDKDFLEHTTNKILKITDKQIKFIDKIN